MVELKQDERLDDLERNGYKIIQNPNKFCFGMDAVSGPVGVAQTVGDAAKTDFVGFLYIGAILTMNLGVFNFIPFPALDGGRFLLLCVEAVRRKPIDKKIEGYINATGLIILFGFMIFVTCKDILNLFG